MPQFLAHFWKRIADLPGRPHLRAVMILGVLCTSVCGTAAPPPVQAPATINLAYRIAFWGIPFGETSYRGVFDGGNYSASSHFETSGIVSLFWQAIIDARASGQISAEAVQPREYDSYYRRGSSRNERVKLSFHDGVVATLADPAYDTTKYRVTEAQQREAMDPMSAITLVLSGVRASSANPCGTSAPVFDGRRRYDIEFTFIKDEPLKLGALFDGRAHLCQLHYRQISGFKPKILKEGAAFPPIYGDFGVFIAPDAPNGRYVLPLRLWCRLGWGTVSADLDSLHISAPAQKQ